MIEAWTNRGFKTLGTTTYFLNNDSTKAMYDEDYW